MHESYRHITGPRADFQTFKIEKRSAVKNLRKGQFSVSSAYKMARIVRPGGQPTEVCFPRIHLIWTLRPFRSVDTEGDEGVS